MFKKICGNGAISNMKLSEILWKIKCNGEVSALKLLIKDEQVREVIKAIGKRSKCKRKVLEEMLQEWTMRNYRWDYDACDEWILEERYLNLIRKHLGRRVFNNDTTEEND
jgi:hypothetical protein